MENRTRTWWQPLTVVAVSLLMAVVGCSRGAEVDDPVDEISQVMMIDGVARVERSRIESQVELVGSLVPWRFATLVAEVDGVIKRIPPFREELEYEIGGQKRSTPVYLDIGHPVRQGEILVEIDSTGCRLALDAAKAKLKLAENELAKLKVWRREEERKQLKAHLDEAVAALDRAEADFERSSRLLERGATPQGEHDQVTMAYLVAKAVKQRAQAAWDIAEAGPMKEEIAIAEAQVALAEAEVKRCEDQIAKCTIRAPYDAVITDRYVGEGDCVTAMPRVEIMQVIDPSILFAQVAMPERFQGRVRQGDVATVKANGRQVPGVVGLVNEKIDPETRTFRVRVGIENAEGLFTSGSFVEVDFAIASASDALIVPREAVSLAEGRPSVFVFKRAGGGNTGRVERRDVVLGIASDTHYAITEGLAEGEEIVADGVSTLTDGLQVILKGTASVSTEVTETKRIKIGQKPTWGLSQFSGSENGTVPLRPQSSRRENGTVPLRRAAGFEVSS